MEDENDPIFKKRVNKQIEQKTKELVAHDKAKPPEVPNPADIDAKGEQDSTVLAELTAAQEEKAKITKEIKDTSKILRDAERRLAVAVRIGEMLGNFRKEFEAFKESLSKDAAEVSLKADDLIAISVDLSSIEKLKTKSNIEIMESKGFLEDPETTGIQKRLSNLEARIIEIQSKLNAPNKAYQAYVQSISDWQQKRLEHISQGFNVTLAKTATISFLLGLFQQYPLLKCSKLYQKDKHFRKTVSEMPHEWLYDQSVPTTEGKNPGE